MCGPGRHRVDGHIITLYTVAVHDNIVTCAVSPCTQSPDTHDDESRLCLSIVTQILLNLGDLSIKFQQQSTQQNLCLLWSSESLSPRPVVGGGAKVGLAPKQTLVNFRYQKLIREFFVTSHFMGINPRNHFGGHTIITSIGRQCLGVTQDKCVDCKVAELSHWPMLTQLLSVHCRPPRVCSKYHSVHVSLSPQLPRYWILLFITYLQF